MGETGDPPPVFYLRGSTPALHNTGEPVALYIKIERDEICELTLWKSGWYLLMISPREAKRRLAASRNTPAVEISLSQRETDRPMESAKETEP